MFCSSPLRCHCLKLSCLHVFLLLLISSIVNLGILVRAFLVFYCPIDICPFNSNCPTFPLFKLSHLSLWPIGHKTKALLKLIFSDVGIFFLCCHLMVFLFCYFFMPIQSIFGFSLWLPNPMFLLSFTNFKLKLSDNFLLKNQYIQIDWVTNIKN